MQSTVINNAYFYDFVITFFSFFQFQLLLQLFIVIIKSKVRKRFLIKYEHDKIYVCICVYILYVYIDEAGESHWAPQVVVIEISAPYSYRYEEFASPFLSNVIKHLLIYNHLSVYTQIYIYRLLGDIRKTHQSKDCALSKLMVVNSCR